MSDFGPIGAGGETWFARSLATVPEDLRDCRPTVFFAVPRVWEKLQEAVLAKVAEAHGVKKAMVDGYLGFGQRAWNCTARDGHAPLWEKLPYGLLDAAVGQRIRHELGLDHARILITAAAPIHPEVIRWFHAIGLPLVELYGQTEVCGPTTCNPPDDNRVGTVGRPFPGVSVRIADDGEILVKGGNVALGYFHDLRRDRGADRRRRVDALGRRWARWTPTATCASRAARRTSSSPRPDRTSRPRRSRPTCPTTTSSPRPSSSARAAATSPRCSR